MGLELLWKSTKLSMVNGKGRIIVIIAIIVDWVDPRKPNKKIQTDLGVGCWVSTVGWVEARNPTIHPSKPNKKIQTDLGVGCWVSLFLRIERFSLTYLFAQPNLRNYETLK